MPASHFQHTKRRALQRYNLLLEPEDVDGMVQQIKNGEGGFVKTLNPHRSLWLVFVEPLKHPLPVVYCNFKDTIVTVLPLQALKERMRLNGNL